MRNRRNGTMEVPNPAEYLCHQDGVFEVTSPHGHVFHVTCRRGTRMSIREVSVPRALEMDAVDSPIWRIRRLGGTAA